MLLDANTGFGKPAMEKTLGETFKPIVNPLERLATATDTNAREIKNLIPKKTMVKEENQDLEVSSVKMAYDDAEEKDDESTELPRGNSSVGSAQHESKKVSRYDLRGSQLGRWYIDDWRFTNNF